MNMGKLDVRRAVGTEGMLTVVKDLGLTRFFYRSSANCIG